MFPSSAAGTIILIYTINTKFLVCLHVCIYAYCICMYATAMLTLCSVFIRCMLHCYRSRGERDDYGYVVL